jgi:hypothetical protein
MKKEEVAAAVTVAGAAAELVSVAVTQEQQKSWQRRTQQPWQPRGSNSSGSNRAPIAVGPTHTAGKGSSVDRNGDIHHPGNVAITALVAETVAGVKAAETSNSRSGQRGRELRLKKVGRLKRARKKRDCGPW